MKLKLMISALLLCSSLSLTGDLTTAPTTSKKKPPVATTAPTSTALQHPDDANLGGIGTGTGSTSAKPKKVMTLRGTSTASEK